MNMLQLRDSLEDSLRVCFIPHLISPECVPERFAWIKQQMKGEPCFALSVFLKFDSPVSAATFASCQVGLLGAADDLAELLESEVEYHTHKEAMVVRVLHHEIILQISHEAIVLQVNLCKNSFSDGNYELG